jgi:hypothetical protein
MLRTLSAIIKFHCRAPSFWKRFEGYAALGYNHSRNQWNSGSAGHVPPGRCGSKEIATSGGVAINTTMHVACFGDVTDTPDACLMHPGPGCYFDDHIRWLISRPDPQHVAGGQAANNRYSGTYGWVEI